MSDIQVALGLKARRVRRRGGVVERIAEIGAGDVRYFKACVGVVVMYVVNVRVNAQVFDFQHCAALVGGGYSRLGSNRDLCAGHIKYGAGRNLAALAKLAISRPDTGDAVVGRNRGQDVVVVRSVLRG